MASRCSRIINMTSISTIRSAIKLNSKSASSTTSLPSFSASTRSASSPLRRLSFSRIPSELGGLQSMLPLHNAVATARMTSCLSSTSRSCRALSQELGLSVPR
ncbi:protein NONRESPONDING TO OXYLIPINS 2, mitochondrial isoform X2 [Capsicum annuum]|uniref:protein NONRESPONDING TO OXYLIPINS 2, mitochondrial isoform X2 n=1 Tax=Capsicum annuum TaxID=4072 RepID=UPI0007BF3C8A|nr:protein NONRESPONDING TO OXYLIPINS 2, mitochondrial isoform X2 [Capsicum annuum]